MDRGGKVRHSFVYHVLTPEIQGQQKKGTWCPNQGGDFLYGPIDGRSPCIGPMVCAHNPSGHCWIQNALVVGFV